MAKQTINRGSTANDGTGTNWRDAWNVVNENFTELYTRQGPVSGTLHEAVVSAVKYFEVSEKYPGELFFISQIIAGTLGSGVYTYYVEISKTTALASAGDVVMKYAPAAGAAKTGLELITLAEFDGSGIQGKMVINWSQLTLGADYQMASWGNGGLHVVNTDKFGSTLLDSRIEEIITTGRRADGTKDLYLLNPTDDITYTLAAVADVKGEINFKNISAHTVTILPASAETIDGFSDGCDIDPQTMLSLIPFNGNYLITKGAYVTP